MSALSGTTRNSEVQTLAPGTRLGRYEIATLLAVGGMAELYLARVRGAGKFEKLVAIKRIRPELTNEGQVVRMFFDEARLAARLQHPNIAQVFDVGTEGRCHFFAMELVEGEDVRAIKGAAAAAGVMIPLDLVLNIGIQVAAALHYAHERRDADGRPLSIVHRDVSPSNIIVSYEGCVKLVDFGIAKAATNSAVTRDGHLRGKFVYMSPEQCAATPLDRRSDIFSLALVLYELVAGRRPFDADNEIAVAHRLMTEDIPPLSSRSAADVPPELEAAVMKALRRDSARRYATAREFQQDLERVLRSRGAFPSAADLGRFVRERCGERQLASLSRANETRDTTGPRATRTAEAHTSATDETTKPSPRPKPRLNRLSAVVGVLGLSMGAVGIFAASRRAASPEGAAEARIVPSAVLEPSSGADAAAAPPRAESTAPTEAGSSDALAAAPVPTQGPATRERTKTPARARPKPMPDPPPSTAHGSDADAPFPGGAWKPKVAADAHTAKP